MSVNQNKNATQPNKRKRHLSKGFTLIESIIVIVLMSFAMLILSTTLLPSINSSATAHYQVRAASLGQSMMSAILYRAFDDNSDFNGGSVRCSIDNGADDCTDESALGVEVFGGTGSKETPSVFNDVDDYIGCWYVSSRDDCGSTTPKYLLTDALGSSVNSDDYANFIVTVKVGYDTEFNDFLMKSIQVNVVAGRYEDFSLEAKRGNY